MNLPAFLDRGVATVFAEVAAARGDATAVFDDRVHHSYAQLALQMSQISAALRARGVGRGSVVGLHLQRSPQAIAALLGILDAGAAYLPFDTGYPPDLLRYIHDDAQPALVLVDDAQAAALFAGAATLTLDALLQTPVDPAPAPAAAGAEDPAYIMYTSGSTGRPKGVVIPHRGILRLVLQTDYADFGIDQTFLQLAPLSFDASTFEIWGALLNGARLALAPADNPSLDVIGDCILRHKVTTLWLTAGLFHLMVEHRIDALRQLRQLLAGGDVLSPHQVARLRAAAPQCALINGYGPTENTTFSCCYRIDAVGDAPIPIGTAIAHSTAQVLDIELQPVAPGSEGELYVGGAGLALGYLRRPQLTAERFVDDPRGGGKLYRTGDRARQRADGVIEFLGRADRQIKINGRRVELDEIEDCARRSGLVQDFAVAAQRQRDGQPRIEAFASLVPAATEAMLRQHLQAQLPAWMQPSRIRILPALPLTPMGKLDRQRLLDSLADPDPAPTPVSLGSDALERELTSIWAALLPQPVRSLDDNFFDLGGTSLQMIAAHAQIQQRYRPQASLVDLYRHPSLRSLAAWLRGEAPNVADDSGARARRQRAALAALRRSGGARRDTGA